MLARSQSEIKPCYSKFTFVLKPFPVPIVERGVASLYLPTLLFAPAAQGLIYCASAGVTKLARAYIRGFPDIITNTGKLPIREASYTRPCHSLRRIHFVFYANKQLSLLSVGLWDREIIRDAVD